MDKQVRFTTAQQEWTEKFNRAKKKRGISSSSSTSVDETNQQRPSRRAKRRHLTPNPELAVWQQNYDKRQRFNQYLDQLHTGEEWNLEYLKSTPLEDFYDLGDIEYDAWGVSNKIDQQTPLDHWSTMFEPAIKPKDRERIIFENSYLVKCSVFIDKRRQNRQECLNGTSPGSKVTTQNNDDNNNVINSTEIVSNYHSGTNQNNSVSIVKFTPTLYNSRNFPWEYTKTDYMKLVTPEIQKSIETSVFFMTTELFLNNMRELTKKSGKWNTTHEFLEQFSFETSLVGVQKYEQSTANQAMLCSCKDFTVLIYLKIHLWNLTSNQNNFIREKSTMATIQPHLSLDHWCYFPSVITQ